MNHEIAPQPDTRTLSHDHDVELDHSFDLVSHIRAAKEAAQREIDAFGDVSEYEIRKIYGQRTDLPERLRGGLISQLESALGFGFLMG